MATGAAAQKQMDGETKAMLFEGASVSQLARIFDMDNRTVTAKLAGVEPCGERAGYPIYRIKDAATRLAPLDEAEVEARLKRMNPADLPKMISKEFWSGLAKRREYEHKAGDLWTSEEVRDAATAVFKQLRTGLLLLPEKISEAIGLTEAQRERVQREVDDMMEKLRARLTLPDRRPAAPGGAESEDGDL